MLLRKRSLQNNAIKPMLTSYANIASVSQCVKCIKSNSNKSIVIPSLDYLNDEKLDNNFYCFLAEIKGDPTSYVEAMHTLEHVAWRKAADDELNSMDENRVWELVEKPAKMSDGSKLNLIDSRWVFKRKALENGKTKFKARLVFRGFKDKNMYGLSETYAPVSRLPVVHAVLSMINKLNLYSVQLDVTTAFLNSELGSEEIYMNKILTVTSAVRKIELLKFVN